MKIGTLAKKVGCDVQTIRYYEREGLLPEPHRSTGGYRLYRSGDVDRLRFIRRCRELDISLAEIRVLLSYRDRPDQTCGEVNTLLDHHVAEIDKRVAALLSLRDTLAALRTRCSDSGMAKDCGILHALER